MHEVRGLSTSFIHVALVTRGRAATRRSSEECREHEEKRGENVILPSCLSIVLEIRQQYWESQDWDMKGMDKRGIWLPQQRSVSAIYFRIGGADAWS
jgi:hypothetical protein